MFGFKDQVVVVTGGGGGIGAAVARRFVNEGARVVVGDYTKDSADATVASLSDPGRGLAMACDVTDVAAVSRLIAAAVDQFGQLDILVNCAGVANIAATPELAPEDWRRVQAINLDGTFYASQAAARAMIAAGRRGSIVNLASVAGLLGLTERAAYVSSKHAVVGLTREMALEFGAAGIRVNAVAPGVIRSPMTQVHFEDEAKVERINKAHPLGRAGTTDEVAAAIAFLASEQAAFITGAVLPVDGGYSAGKMW